jgi:RND family efflux transporter MFP subunit
MFRFSARALLFVMAPLGIGAAWATIPKREHPPKAVVAASPLRVVVTHASTVASDRPLVLPGTVEALRSTVIFARTNGYLKARFVDIGDRVKKNEILAIIETPELDQQLEQARADVLQAKAALERAKTAEAHAEVSLERIKTLAPAGVASKQDLDDRKAQYDGATASVRSAEASIAAGDANIRRLLEMKRFARVTAPFSGTITERMIEVGSLITAGNATNQALFALAESDPARVIVAVPETASTSIREGDVARISVRELPGRVFVGRVVRDARALDRASRTLLTEIHAPNGDGALLPGMYAQVSLAIERSHAPVTLDASALIVGRRGPEVAVLGTDGKIHLRQIHIDFDEGATVAISEGLSASEDVVLNPDPQLEEGMPAIAAE